MQRMEASPGKGAELTFSPGKPIDFGSKRSPQPVSLQPFADNHYNDFDELLVDMLAHGYFITDYRRLKGIFTHYNDVLPFIEQGYVVEEYGGQIILVKRDPGVIHGDIWVVDRDLVRGLKLRHLLKRDHAAKHGSYKRDVTGKGVETLSTLSPRERELLDERQSSITRGLEREAEYLRERARAEQEALSRVDSGPRQEIEVRPSAPSPSRFAKIEAPAFKKVPRAKSVSHDTVLGVDHEGKPVTAKDVAAEGRKTPPKGLPKGLVPDAPEDVSDEQWERLMLIEQVKFRRLHGL